MRTGRSNATYVKAKDLEPGMVVATSGMNSNMTLIERKVMSVRRAADVVTDKQAEVGKAKTRAKLRDVVDDLYDALRAIDNNGREARMVRFEGQTRAIPFMSQDELRYVRRA